MISRCDFSVIVEVTTSSFSPGSPTCRKLDIETERSLSKLCPLVLRWSAPLERRVDREFGGPSILLRFDVAPRRGGGAGGAFTLEVPAVKASLRGRLVREALDGVRVAELATFDGCRRGGGGGMAFASAACSIDVGTLGGVSIAGEGVSDALACALLDGGGGGAGFSDCSPSATLAGSICCVEPCDKFDVLLSRPCAVSG